MRPAQVSRVARTALKLQQRTVAAAATAAAPAAGSLASALNQQLSGAQVGLGQGFAGPAMPG
jgi:hypothetical protein